MSLLLCVALASAEPPSVPESLRAFAPLVGQWRGVGQVRRGSARGAWRETAEWRYDFADGAAVVYDVTGGGHVREVRVREGEDGLVATVTSAKGEPSPAGVERDGERWVIAADGGLRLTVTPLNEKRTTVLIEDAAAGRPRRLGEVGYTRAGERLAVSGSGGPQCVVTGGRGTIKVSHAGRDYWVCCTGCKAAFEADPEAILAEAAARAADAGQTP